MKEILELFNTYGAITVGFIVVTMLVGVRNIYEYLSWLKKKLTDWSDKRNGIERKEISIEERIGALESLKDGQIEMRKMLTDVISAVDKLSQRQTVAENNTSSCYSRFQKVEAETAAQEQKIINLRDTLDECNLMIAEVQITNLKNLILDFSDIATDMKRFPSRERYSSIFKTYDEYEKILKKLNRTNGETELSMNAIRKSYEYRTTHHLFMEDKVNE